MNKLVYLFELDSVRKSDEEIELGQKAIYNEIAVNGNTVVLTYNQLVESRAFFSLLNEKDSRESCGCLSYYDSLITMFEKGKIRISQYGDIRTVSQYLQRKIEDDRGFIFSAFPIKSTQKRLAALVRRSLIFSDLSEIHNYLTGTGVTEDDLIDLFTEGDGHGNAQKGREEINPDNDPDGMRARNMKASLESLYWILSIVLRLSALHDIYIPPRKPEEYENLRMRDYLAAAVQLRPDKAHHSLRASVDSGQWGRACRIIRELLKDNGNSRSDYLHAILKMYNEKKCGSSGTEAKADYQYAEAVVNLCYNYACESSICGTSKHYNVSELTKEGRETATFRDDFFQRLKEDWQDKKTSPDERYLQEETNAFIPYNPGSRKKQPLLSKAVRIVEYEKKKADPDSTEEIRRYEYEMEKERKKFRRHLFRNILKNLGLSLLCVLAACIVSLILQDFQNAADGGYKGNIRALLRGCGITILFLFVSEGLTALLAKMIPKLMPLGEALGRIRKLFSDSIGMIFRKAEVHSNPNRQNTNQKETAGRPEPISFICPPELKAYTKLYGKEKGRLFSNPEGCPTPIPDVADPVVRRRILREEELSGRRFGTVYQSEYNTLLADPVENEDGSLGRYERVVPSSHRNGVVMLTAYRDCFVLLRQFRHALRREQFAFPRGFAYENETPRQSAERELKEELKAKIKDVFPIGRVSPDSGLSGVTAYVYYVELEDYHVNKDHEGILDAVEVPKESFIHWIRENGIDDGFTLSAYMIYLSGS